MSAAMSMSVKYHSKHRCVSSKVMKITVTIYFQILETLVLLTAAVTVA